MALGRPALVALLLLLALPASGRHLRADDAEPAEPWTPAEREAALARARELNATLVALHRQGRYAEAEPVARQALSLRERALGPEHPLVASSLNNLAVLLKARGRYEEAQALYERALEIREAALGPDHALVAQSLNNLAALLQATGRYEPARALYERALGIRERTLGPEHPSVAESLNNLAALLKAQGRYGRARSLLERALGIYERTLGPGHPSVAAGLNNLAGLLEATGQHEEARRLLERALRISEAALGPEHPEVAVSLGNLASLLRTTGRYEEARPLLERALGIYEQALGGEHPAVATGLNNLASLLKAQGQFERARVLFERALRIYEQAFGPRHPYVATGLNNLGLLLQATGQHEQARALFERALGIWETALGPDHPDVATSLNNLAFLLRAMGRCEEARPLFERALRIYEETLGSEHAYVATSLGNLAQALHATGEHEEARVLFERAFRIAEAALGADHPDVATGLGNLAMLLLDEGRHEEARPLCERALAIREECLGPEHPDVAASLHDLARVLEADGECEQAAAHLERCLAIVDGHIRRSFAGLQMAERMALTQILRPPLDAWLRLAPRVGRSGYAEVLRFKGLVERASTAERRLARRGGPEAAARVAALRAAGRRLARLAHSMPSRFAEEERAAWQEAYAKAAADRETLALGLARDFAPLREGLERLDLGRADVQARLARDAVLVDYLRSGDRYLAWIVRPEGEARRIDLGPADAIEGAAVAFADLTADRDTDLGDEAWLEAGRRLRDLVVEPVHERLDERVRTLCLCPDAALAAVPFACLPGAREGRFLLDDHVLLHVSMAQDLVPWPEEGGGGGGALLVGGVDYERAAEGTQERPLETTRRVLAAADRAPQGGAFDALPETAEEVAFLVSRLGEDAEVLAGAGATEARFRRAVRGRGRLHVATHGFVREDLMAGFRRRHVARDWLGTTAERHLVSGYDPMMLSGLAFAGANPREGGGGDDGILTAAEASYLDLDGVDLVVLSACRTALGRTESGEGVVGLVRGFHMAGARRVIASLWQVNDEATRLLMQHLYDRMLREEDPLAPAEALREAARAVRAASGAEGRSFAPPRFWAAFVAYGR